MEETLKATFVVVGGGIAGVSCVEQLCFECPTESIILVSSSPLIKRVTNISRLTRTLESFEVTESGFESLEKEHTNITILHDVLTGLNTQNKEIYLSSNRTLQYNKLCLCMGASPKLICSTNPYVIGIRDTESVDEFSIRIKDARKIVLVGNGGIATETVYEISGVTVIWVIRDKSLATPFIDPGASEFFMPQLNTIKAETEPPTKRTKYSVKPQNQHRKSEDIIHKPKGGALGPDWHSGLVLSGGKEFKNVNVEYECEVKNVLSADQAEERGINEVGEAWPVYVELTNGHIHGCDLIISATGVTPNTNILTTTNIKLEDEERAVLVNERMMTSVQDVFAAGDICTAGWENAQHWFQMRLWTQARQMGLFTGKSMAASLTNTSLLQDFCFELFAHVTKFFGYKVVLLGLYNGQGLNNQYDILLRVTKGQEYVKVVLQNGKMQGALLIGETDLEETFENLILNQMDLSDYGEDLLNPDVDIEDYFD